MKMLSDKQETMEAIILAGGLGTRLSSRLTDRPKSMAPVAGRPFLEILLDQLGDAGCKRVILSVGHMRRIILDAFQEQYCTSFAGDNRGGTDTRRWM